LLPLMKPTRVASQIESGVKSQSLVTV
jgi:hypothetical protein